MGFDLSVVTLNQTLFLSAFASFYLFFCPVHRARTWKQGQGHVGKAFSDGTAKITGDALDPNVASLMSPPSTLARGYDRQAYRSFASIPIVLENDLETVYGVLVATSDEVNRFNKFNCLILQHLADTLASVIVLERDN
jgi:GAF domain-containing protein